MKNTLADGYRKINKELEKMTDSLAQYKKGSDDKMKQAADKAMSQ